MKKIFYITCLLMLANTVKADKGGPVGFIGCDDISSYTTNSPALDFYTNGPTTDKLCEDIGIRSHRVIESDEYAYFTKPVEINNNSFHFEVEVDLSGLTSNFAENDNINFLEIYAESDFTFDRKILKFELQKSPEPDDQWIINVIQLFSFGLSTQVVIAPNVSLIDIKIHYLNNSISQVVINDTIVIQTTSSVPLTYFEATFGLIESNMILLEGDDISFYLGEE